MCRLKIAAVKMPGVAALQERKFSGQETVIRGFNIYGQDGDAHGLEVV